MKVVIVGAGRLGTQFAAVLAGNGNQVTVVDQNPALAPTLVGDG